MAMTSVSAGRWPMSTSDGQTFTCANCHRTLPKEHGDDELRAEYEAVMPPRCRTGRSGGNGLRPLLSGIHQVGQEDRTGSVRIYRCQRRQPVEFSNDGRLGGRCMGRHRHEGNHWRWSGDVYVEWENQG